MCSHLSSPLCQKSLCVITSTHEAVVTDCNLLVLCFSQEIDINKVLFNFELNSQESRNEGTFRKQKQKKQFNS